MGLFDKLKKTFGFTSDDDSKTKQNEEQGQSAAKENEDAQLEQTEGSKESSEENGEEVLHHSTENDEANFDSNDDNDEDLEAASQLDSEEQKSSSIIENQDEKPEEVVANNEETENAAVSTSEKVTNEKQVDKSEAVDDGWEMTTKNETSDSDDQSKEKEEQPEEPVQNPKLDSVSETTDDDANQVDQPQAEKSETGRYTHGLTKTRSGFKGRINALLANFRHVDEDFFDDLEEMLIESDVGFEAAMKISNELRDEVKFQNAKSKAEVSEVIVEKLVDLYEDAGKDQDEELHFAKEGPTVFLFVGVNGVGKTTTIGKLAKRYKDEGKKVMVAAGDTFRAGAIQQLDEWAKRVGVTIVKKNEKSDPASVVYDAVTKAKKENYDILLVDTAGRLQNKVNLMNELEKIQRVITREIPDAPHEVLLALDATTGQNALSQAKQFKDATNVTGIILTKLDGTARGGIVLAIRNELHIPVKLVGLGEQVDDLRDFNAEDFAYGLFKGLILSREN